MHRRIHHLVRSAFWVAVGVPSLVALLGSSLLGARPALAAIPAFDSEIVDAGSGDTGLYASLRRDSSGNLHVAYYDSDLEGLRYAWQSGGEWHFETVDASSWCGWFSTLALDSNDEPHILYRDVSNSRAKYAVRSNGVWAFETLPQTGVAAMDLVLDAQDAPHVSMHYTPSVDLLYATKATGSWVVETVETAGNTGAAASIALDSMGRPHISYDQFDGVHMLRHAFRNTNGTWTRETVDSGLTVGQFTSIAITPGNEIHIAYSVGGATDDLRYAKFRTSWSTETVDSAGDVGGHASIALDGTNPEIAYEDATNGTLRLAVRNGASWDLETVDNAAVTGLLPSNLAGSSRAIAYYSTANTSLELATYSAGRWGYQTLDEGGDVGPYSSLALGPSAGSGTGSANSPRIAYQDAVHEDLRFASWNGTDWDIELVDTGTSTGFFASLALDGSGDPHIAYYDAMSDDILYASKSGTWSSEIVDGGRTDGQCDLAIAADGTPMISYRDPLGGTCRFAEFVNGSWSLLPVDGSGDAGYDTAIACDSASEPHILHRWGSFLRHVWRDNGGWQGENVTNMQFNGYGNDIVVDAMDDLHASFLRRDTGELYYGIRPSSGGGWSVEVVDTGLFGTWESSIAIGPNGEPRIAYYDPNGKDLRYALRDGGTWETGAIDTNETVGRFPSVAFGSDGLARVSYHDPSERVLRMATEIGASDVAIGSGPGGVAGTGGSGWSLLVAPNPARSEGTTIRWTWSGDGTGDVVSGGGLVGDADDPVGVVWSGATGADTRSNSLSIRIFDAQGRVIRTLEGRSGNAPNGPTRAVGEVHWDTRDDRGIPVPSGVYFVNRNDRQARFVGGTRIVVQR
ncbi:MAG: hypothetical protein R3E97_00860 [Candidatus Eisenbacteria bacterium]